MSRIPADTGERVQRYLGRELWTLDLSERRAPTQLGVRALRLVLVIVRAARDTQLNNEAMGLVYATLLSLVPVLAVTFSVLKAFGVDDRIEPFLSRLVEPLGPKSAEVTERVIGFVGNVNVGVLGAVGLAMLFYTVVSLVERVENALNRIWQVRASRGMIRKYSDYLSFLLVGPVLIVAAFAIIAAAQSHWLVQRSLAWTGFDAVVLAMARHVTPFLLLAAAFTLLYRLLPFTRVAPGAAVAGGVTTAILWQVAGVAFAALVAGSASYAAIYSTFAVLVLSLMWLHFAWLIVLIGGQVAAVCQYPTAYVVAGTRLGMVFGERLGLSLLAEVARCHVEGVGPCRLEGLTRTLRVPLGTLEETIEDFVARGILARAAEPDAVVLTRPPEQVTVLEVLETIRDPLGFGRLSLGVVDRVSELLERRERAVRDALGSLTLRDLASGRTDKCGPGPLIDAAA